MDAPAEPGAHLRPRPAQDAGRREGPGDALVVVQRQADLLEVVRALDPAGRLAGRLDGGQQQGDQHGDDGDDDQQLDQREGTSRHTHRVKLRRKWTQYGLGEHAPGGRSPQAAGFSREM